MVSIFPLRGIAHARHSPPVFVLPESFDPSEFLTAPKLRRRFDDARYFISLVLTKTARHDVDERGLVRLMARHLASIMNRKTYAEVLTALRYGKVIERFPYCVGDRSYGFRLGKRFIADKHVRVQATDPRLIRQWDRFNEEAAAERDSRMKPIHHELASRQAQLEIDSKDARRILDALPIQCNPFDTQGILIANIEQHQFFTSVGRFGRISNNISSMKRELRRSLHVQGEQLKSIDLSCAQPALLGKLIMDREAQNGGAGTKQSKYDYDLRRYVSLVQSGLFYDFMVEQLSDYGISRDEFKRRFLADVIAKRGRYPSIVEDRFRELFPSVYQFIRCINSDNHANLIRLLQVEESKFVIETIATDFVGRHPKEFLITLHDAIYTTPRNLTALRQSFDRGFEHSGFPMRLKVEV